VYVNTDTVGTWPWKACDNDPEAWCEINEEHADYCLNVLPPIYFPGGFAVSEPVRADASGQEVYLALVTWHGRPFARYLNRQQMKTAARELHDHLDAMHAAAA
jgi:hypothetical protein